MNRPGLSISDRRVLLSLLLFVVALYVPFAGNYGMWDPWETHYSEVARQMRARGDYISLWWPGSPQDRNEFWSKPVLTFWLMALGFAVTGMGGHPPSIPGDFANAQWDGEMAVGWLAEWSVRIPFILCGIACIWAVWELTRRLTNRRAALWACIVLATSSQFFYISRQAMTDMAFVAPMAVALCMAGLSLILPREEVEAELPRRGSGRFSWPHTPAFYWLAALAALTVVPQLVMMSVGLRLSIVLGNKQLRMIGLVPMLPYIAAFLVWAFYALRARCRRQIYLHIAFLMCGLATLAKGPAGLAMPVIAVVLYVVVEKNWKVLAPPWRLPVAVEMAPPVAAQPAFDAAPAVQGTEDVAAQAAPVVDAPPAPAPDPGWTAKDVGRYALRFVQRHPLELGLGLLLFIAVTFPWYHAMLIRHGMGFWNEFIGDNYVHRAAGRHGDRGTFEYYLLQIAVGMFPWVGVVAAAGLSTMGRLKARFEGDLRPRLRVFAVVWFLVMFTVVSLVNTKFHHYILPGLPALAILAGLYLDELFTEPRVADAMALLFVGLPMLAMGGRDIASYPARLTWLFDYDYVNAPNGGRAYPLDPQYDYKARAWAFVAVALCSTLVLGLSALWRAKRGARLPEAEHDDESIFSGSAGGVAVAAALAVAAVAGAAFLQEPFGDGLPHVSTRGWIYVAGMCGLFLLLFLVGGLFGARARGRMGASLGLLAVGVMATTWTAWGLDRLLTDLSPHWAQKHVIAAYYKNRSGPDEPLIAWQMYWRGETFYTKNSIYDHRMQQLDKTVFLGDHNAEKMQTWFKTHGGRRVFFLVERSRFESLRALLPEAAKATLKVVDQSNNKVYLGVATLPPSDPTPEPTPKK